MKKTLQILHLEDSELDAELIRHALSVGDFSCRIDWVNNFADYQQAMENTAYDLVLSDYSLPDCDGLKAFAQSRQLASPPPFILVTGALGEELAIDTLKAGVTDYVLKSNLVRLQTAVPRAIDDARLAREKQATLDALRVSEERFDLAVRGSGAGIWDWADLSSEQMWWSPRIYELLDYREGQVPATRSQLYEMMHPEDVEATQEAIAQHLATRQPYDIEFRIRTGQGNYLWLRSRGQAVWDAQGQPLRMAGYIQDITDRKYAEAERRELEMQLRQTQKMEAIGTLAGGIAHDFNNILASILGYGSMVERRLQKDSREQADMCEVLKAAERAKQLVRQILTFSRKSGVEKQPVQVDLIIQEVLQLMRASLPSTIQLVQSLEGGGETIFADATQVYQLLMNLCTNAYHAMPEGGTLSILLDKWELAENNDWGLAAGPYLQLQVKDTGTGIPPELQERVFDPYFTTKDVDSGTGLGLSMVRGIVTSLGGQIRVNSRPGLGTCFTLMLPCLQKAASMTEIETDVVDITGEGNIMLVDDETSLALLGKEFLEDLGYTVTAQTSSLAALEHLREHHDQYDLLLTDLTMPRMTGIELARNLGELAPELPVVLCSGLKLSLDTEGISETNICQVLLKTDLFDELPKLLKTLLGGGIDASRRKDSDR